MESTLVGLNINLLILQLFPLESTHRGAQDQSLGSATLSVGADPCGAHDQPLDYVAFPEESTLVGLMLKL